MDTVGVCYDTAAKQDLPKPKETLRVTLNDVLARKRCWAVDGKGESASASWNMVDPPVPMTLGAVVVKPVNTPVHHRWQYTQLSVVSVATSVHQIYRNPIGANLPVNGQGQSRTSLTMIGSPENKELWMKKFPLANDINVTVARVANCPLKSEATTNIFDGMLWEMLGQYSTFRNRKLGCFKSGVPSPLYYPIPALSSKVQDLVHPHRSRKDYL
ncbi:hypothetical protein EI94DRAFT_1914471 [Lactarius quietus]|nr:hypothetical protein EI94DRAFT_1914471 [Lactarius quietus]